MTIAIKQSPFFLPIFCPANFQEGESDDAMDLQLYHVILLVMKIIKECPRMLRQETSDNTLGMKKSSIGYYPRGGNFNVFTP